MCQSNILALDHIVYLLYVLESSKDHHLTLQEFIQWMKLIYKVSKKQLYLHPLQLRDHLSPQWQYLINIIFGKILTVSISLGIHHWHLCICVSMYLQSVWKIQPFHSSVGIQTMLLGHILKNILSGFSLFINRGLNMLRSWS